MIYIGNKGLILAIQLGGHLVSYLCFPIQWMEREGKSISMSQPLVLNALGIYRDSSNAITPFVSRIGGLAGLFGIALSLKNHIINIGIFFHLNFSSNSQFISLNY